jgi:hypothetical protein
MMSTTGRRLAAVVAGLLALVPLSRPAQAHAGGPTARPVLTSVEPFASGFTVRVVFVDSWRIELTSQSAEPVSVLDAAGRPFLRFSRSGVEADAGASGWRLVSRVPTWTWVDTRIRPEPGLLTKQVLSSTVAIRLRDFDIPLLVGTQPGHVTGYLRYEPPTGTYRHTILSSAQPVRGLRVGEILGRAAPTLTLDNETGTAVTVLGRDGEPLARLAAGGVDANLTSPTWTELSQSLGLATSGVADPAGAPHWERILEGRRWSWADYRSAPPELPAPLLTRVLAERQPIVVKRWAIPIQVGGRRIEVRGVTDFVPIGARDDLRHRRLPARPVLAVSTVTVGAALVLRRRYGAPAAARLTLGAGRSRTLEWRNRQTR